MSNYTISGRIVALDGTPVSGATVKVFEIRGLADELERSSTSSGTDGRYIASWSQTGVPAPWDLLVRASKDSTTVDSPLISDLDQLSLTVDLIVGTGPYEGLSEWDRVAAKVEEYRGNIEPKDIPVERFEWLARRADVFPTHLAAYVQAHRLADERTIKPRSCYAFLRYPFSEPRRDAASPAGYAVLRC